MISFPRRTKMLQFRRFDLRCHCNGVFKKQDSHSDIPGSKVACAYPGLIAACHVLHRRLVPRHPPLCTLLLDRHSHLQLSAQTVVRLRIRLDQRTKARFNRLTSPSHPCIRNPWCEMGSDHRSHFIFPASHTKKPSQLLLLGSAPGPDKKSPGPT